MKKTLRSLFLLMLAAGAAKAQWSNAVSSWNYNFVNGTSGIWNTDGENISTSPTPFLPQPPSGTARVSVPAGSGASYILDKTSDKLTMIASASGSSKFSVYTIAGATEIAKMSFTISFGQEGPTAPANNTAFVWSIGYRGANNNIYSNNNAVYTSLNSGGNLFNAVRFLYNSTNGSYVVGYRTTGTTSNGNFATLSGGALSPGTSYFVEVYCNNSEETKSYVKSAITYDVKPASYHLWITNLSTSASVRYFFKPASENVYDLPKSEEIGESNQNLSIPSGTYLNAFLIQGAANVGNRAKIEIQGGMGISYNLSTLPVSLTSFNASKAKNSVHLNWQTASEQNNQYFDILRSVNGKDFVSIGTIKGAGTTSETKSYAFTDYNPVSGYNYYKLKQVDGDGKSTVYDDKVQAINWGLESQEISAYSLENKLIVKLNSVSETLGNIALTTIAGQQVISKNVNVTKGDSEYVIDLGSISEGIYIAKIQLGELSKIVKILK